MEKNIRFAILFFFFLMTGCKGYSLDSIPYVVSADFVMEDDSPDYTICGVDFYFINKSDKEIKKINIVFYLFDQDGEPANECRSNISIEFELSIMPQEESRFCLSLDSFMNAIPETPLFIDYLYLAKIEYEDGSVWEDPFGLMAFK